MTKVWLYYSKNIFKTIDQKVAVNWNKIKSLIYEKITRKEVILDQICCNGSSLVQRNLKLIHLKMCSNSSEPKKKQVSNVPQSNIVIGARLVQWKAHWYDEIFHWKEKMIYRGVGNSSTLLEIDQRRWKLVNDFLTSNISLEIRQRLF